jgi:hypothetical protein
MNKIDKNNYNLYVIIIIFTLSRFFYYYLGIRFEIFLDSWQFFPFEFYKDDLINSIFYNFAQPPLLNWIIGISIQLSEQHFKYILHIFYIMISLFSFITLYKLLNLLKFKKKNCLILVIIFLICPTSILLENHGYKDFLVFAILIFSIYFSLKITNTNNLIDFFFVGFFISLLCLLRETFHLFWAYIFLISTYFILKKKRILLSIAVVTFLVLPFYLKNFIIFKNFQIGGWMYENLSQKYQFTSRFTNNDIWLKKLIFENNDKYNEFTKTLSPIWSKASFTNAYEYKELLNYNYKYKHKLLHSDSFHNEVMLEVDKIRKFDFYQFLYNHPTTFVFSSINSLLRHFFNSTDSFLFFQNNSIKISTLIRITDCAKLTLRCFYQFDIPKNYYELENFQKIYFSLNQINFLFVITYLLFLMLVLKNFLCFSTFLKKDKIIYLWSLTFLFNLFILVLFEDTEIPRHRFPFDYLSIIFLLNFIKLSKKSIFK